MQKLYTATVSVEGGGRNGHIRSSDGVLNLDVRMPKELGGSGEHATNPEQLFAAGYAACFDSAVNLVARTRRIRVTDTSVTADVTIGKVEDGTFELAVVLNVKIPGISYDAAREIAEAAHQVCPYSKATRGNIDVELNVVEV
ncbi:organic hydroperoxide resistance protein [Alicyclobacillus fastidiosus]|uniref:Organic hydroperoxide resistance protein n=1 Tax=Alicyclobacillus fastidiosus TaxID=392011 RepID=A0ABV5AI15_9BACL|nr:organic hydroperoxide resistance protein [Alicyclobacillus fastidiosus]WEH10106.1 organic hydroperoxide resistance protein [Alicyclobacillus fastidiosus]